MKLYYYQGAEPNFGDELNHWLWPKLLPGLWDENEAQTFLGIGSILYDDFPAEMRKIVLGAGFAGYTGKPNMHDGSWDVFFVRGPQTAEVLGLDPSLALTDGAILIRTQPLPAPAAARDISFMPHFESLERGRWQEVCDHAGIQLIDPRWPVERVMSLILGSTLLLTEAMHGAIVSDALRVPWIPLRPIVPKHRFKWIDWTRSVQLPYEPFALAPSSAMEAWIAMTGRAGEGSLSQSVAKGPLGHLAQKALIPLAAKKLLSLARQRPMLSRDDVTESLTARAVEKVDALRGKYRAG